MHHNRHCLIWVPTFWHNFYSELFSDLSINGSRVWVCSMLVRHLAYRNSDLSCSLHVVSLLLNLFTGNVQYFQYFMILAVCKSHDLIRSCAWMLVFIPLLLQYQTPRSTQPSTLCGVVWVITNGDGSSFLAAHGLASGSSVGLVQRSEPTGCCSACIKSTTNQVNSHNRSAVMIVP